MPISKILFSVVIPVYNVEKYIENCVHSILFQNTDNIEIILINDGSTDESGNLCQKLAENNSNVSIFHQVNKGVSATRNLGISKASGEYIHFVDADDLIVNGAYVNFANCILEHNPDIIVFNYKNKRVSGNLQPEESIKSSIFTLKNKEVLLESLFHGIYHGFVWDKVIKTDFLKSNKLLFKEDLRFHEDCLFCFDLYSLSNKILFSNDVFYYHLINEDSSMARYWENKKFDERYILTLDAFDYMDSVISEKYSSLKKYFDLDYVNWCVRIYFEAKSKKYKNKQYYNRLRSSIRKRISNIDAPRYKLRGILIILIPSLYILYKQTKNKLLFYRNLIKK